MIATVISVEPFKMQGKWDGYNFTYQGEPFQGRQKDPTTRFVFGNSPVAPDVSRLKAGEKVDLTFVQGKNPKFKDLDAVEVIRAGEASPAPKSQGAKPSYQSQDSGDKDLKIMRAVAFKGGIELHSALVQAGLTKVKKTAAAELHGAAAIELARQFEGYLSLKDDVDEMTTDTSGLGENIPFDQETYQD